MNNSKLIWRERMSESAFVASVWMCSTIETIERSVLADPCISMARIKENGETKVVLSGPNTEPRIELLTTGYECLAIRFQTGVVLKGFPTQKFTNRWLTIPASASSRFEFEGAHLQFPGFKDAELLVDQLFEQGYLSYETSTKGHTRKEGMSSKSYARLTKHTTGLSPYKLHQLQRIHRALQLLKQGMPAATVATDLGFVDQAHLTRSAKQFLGHTPKELLDLPQSP